MSLECALQGHCWIHVTALEVEMALTLPPHFACCDCICGKPFSQELVQVILSAQISSDRISVFLSPCSKVRNAPSGTCP